MKKTIYLIGTLLSFGIGYSQNTFPTGVGTNVGIGTTAPSTRLQVTSASSGTSGLRLTNLTSSNPATASNGKALTVDPSGIVVLTPVLNTAPAANNIYTANGTLAANRTVSMNGKNLIFNPTTANSQFYIDGLSGNVGIGSLTPGDKLVVSGTTRASALFSDNGISSGTTATFNDYVKSAHVLGAGYTTTYSNWPTKRHGFNVFDFYKSGSNHINDEVVVNIVDRAGVEKVVFHAGSADGTNVGYTIFGMKNSSNAELFKISDDLPNTVFLHMPQLSSRIVLGNYGNYLMEHKFVVDNGSSFFNGNIIGNANVGIGTSVFIDGTDTYRLSVDGNIRAKRVKVYTTWADFVFEKNYELPTLEEVEKHIQENGHLKDIPSAKEVEENGIDVGEMNKRLLQKVEELTLYIIDMNKELQEVKSQLNKQ